MSTRGAVVVLTLITAVVHLFVGWPPQGIDALLFLNGLGYLVLLAAWWRTPAFLSRHLVRWVYMLYTAVTIVGYFAVWGLGGLTDAVGMFTKVVEVLLILALWREG